MKSLITKSVVKIVVAIVLCIILSLAVSHFAPHITNDMAIGQLENDDMSWSMMESWNSVIMFVPVIQAGIGVVCGFSVTKDTITYLNGRKEKEINEEC